MLLRKTVQKVDTAMCPHIHEHGNPQWDRKENSSVWHELGVSNHPSGQARRDFTWGIFSVTHRECLDCISLQVISQHLIGAFDKIIKAWLLVSIMKTAL